MWGSSALRAAMARSLMGEAAATRGFATAAVLFGHRQVLRFDFVRSSDCRCAGPQLPAGGRADG
eukprot:7337603-Pyramimonas_sp.AAC.1